MARALALATAAALVLSAWCAPSRSVGILYNVNSIQAAQLQAQVAALGAAPLTTELVLRSDGALTLNDVYGRGLPLNISTSRAAILDQIYGAQPAMGFYCLYTRRPSDPLPAPAPDCVNASGIARAHAAALVAAGVDWIVLDATNWPIYENATYDPTSSTARGSLLVDATLIRPIEVLLETWAALRAAGVPTPRVAAWPCAPSPSIVPAARATWRHFLEAIYNNPAYADLVLTDARGKKVFFMSPKPGAKGQQCFGADTLALVEANGGRHDVAVTQMWAQISPSAFASGEWGFFSPCTDGGNSTSAVVDAPPCAQFVTRGADGAVVEVTASTGWMLAASGLPYAAPGHLRGLTLARQFEAVLATSAPYLLVSSFNEHTGGRVDMSSTPHSRIAFNQGLPRDAQRELVWVDAYAAEFTRNLEPTVEGGGRVWEVLVACVALYKRGATCVGAPPGDACCSRDDKEVFRSVWSLVLPSSGSSPSGSGAPPTPPRDHMLAGSRAERDALLTAGWVEVCSPISHPSTFCVDKTATDGRDGPFVVYSSAGASPLGPTRPLLRCVDTASGAHSFTTAPACDAGTTLDVLLGHVATTRGGEMLRALRRCRGAPGTANASATRFHSCDLDCDVPDDGGGVMGFVR